MTRSIYGEFSPAPHPGRGEFIHVFPVVPPPANIQRPSGTKSVFRFMTEPIARAPRA